MGAYPDAELVWVQEEPSNQGGWPYVGLLLPQHLDGRRLRLVSRAASASPATGSSRAHSAEQRALVDQALDR